MEDYKETRNLLWQERHREILDAHERYTRRMKELQERCPHKETRYFPDASGNNDSWIECVDCNKEL